MKCKIKIIHTLISLLVLLAGWQSGFGADKPDYSRMKKDLNLMSTILDKIMNPENDRFPGEGNTRAVYLEGQGVLFIFREKMNFSRIIISDNGNEVLSEKYQIDATSAAAKSKKNIAIRKEEKIEVTKPEEAAANKAQKLNAIKTKLGEFLGDYCGAMKQLAPNEQVTVMVISENSAIFRLNHSMTFQQQPEATQLVAAVSFGDISAARRGEINQETFFNRLQFRHEPTGAQVDKDLQIMSNIFSVALQQNKETDWVFANDISGIYLQNFGALFVLNFRRNFRTKMLQVQTDYENLLSIINEEEQHFEKKGKALADELKGNVIEVLADYGHNLKQLKNEEWIGVSLELNQISSLESEPSSLFIKVGKNAATAVNQAKIDRNEFKKRVVVTSY